MIVRYELIKRPKNLILFNWYKNRLGSNKCYHYKLWLAEKVPNCNKLKIIALLRLLTTITALFVYSLLAAQHPVGFYSKTDLDYVKVNMVGNTLLLQSFETLKKETDPWLNKEVDVPLPKDAAGGYTHEKHKANYLLLFNSGILYSITGKQEYADLVGRVLLQYAKLNTMLKNHPQATSSSPGRIFWQALNDANWLVYTSMAYDMVYYGLKKSDRDLITQGAFKPEVDFITQDLKPWFNLIHNHAVWATAAVGMVGIATDNPSYIQLALKGSSGNGTTGFYALMDQLFSPDGYYTEGPYYTRYALLPFMIFANALNNKFPEQHFFQYRKAILEKALSTALQHTNTDGMFFPMNDAIKDKDYTTSEMLMALNIATKAYGVKPAYLFVAQKQGRVLLGKGGVQLAKALLQKKSIPNWFPYKSIENTDGPTGENGGLSVLRLGSGADLSSLIFKYTSHGLSHGHFDKLNLNLFDGGKEILQDYGSARFVGVEQKYGGRYLPENAKYAVQTIAHNTLVVDETSHFKGEEKIAEKYAPTKRFSNLNAPTLMVASAMDTNAYVGVRMDRTVYFLELPNQEKMVIDLFWISSATKHQYDLPFHYLGQFIHASFPYQSSKSIMNTMGKKNGYQYLWKEAEARVGNSTAQFSFMNGKTFYSLSSLIQDSASLFFGRSGANDPDFNLRHDPVFVIRKNANKQTFLNVLEIHGKYDPVMETSSGGSAMVQQINMLQDDQEMTAAKIICNNQTIFVFECRNNLDNKSKHQFEIGGQHFDWVGPYAIFFNGTSVTNGTY